MFGNIIESLLTFNSRTLTFYVNYDSKIDFRDIRKILLQRLFVWHYISLLFLIYLYIGIPALFIYRECEQWVCLPGYWCPW